MTKNKVKSIVYSYPTSPNAGRFRFENGCYTVQTTRLNPRKPPVAVASFATLNEAKQYAETMPLNWDTLSL